MTLDNVKIAVGVATGWCAGGVIQAIIKNNVDEPETTYEKVELRVATFALGGAAGMAARVYTDQLVDTVATLVTKTPIEEPTE